MDSARRLADVLFSPWAMWPKPHHQDVIFSLVPYSDCGGTLPCELNAVCLCWCGRMLNLVAMRIQNETHRARVQTYDVAPQRNVHPFEAPGCWALTAAHMKHWH